MTKSMYDAKLSDITNKPVTWRQDSDGKVYLSFNVNDEMKDNRYVYHERVVSSRYFSNYSVDTVRFNNKRYLIDSPLDAVEAVQ